MAEEKKTSSDPRTLRNPINDPKSNTIWPVIAFLFTASFAWFLTDPALRRGLAEITGFQALEPIVEHVINREFTIDLHGTWTSTCTQRVMLIAREKDLDYDLKIVDTAGRAHKSSEHMAKHPFGQIPVLEVGEHDYLFESRAIASYLTKRFKARGTQFYVSGLRNEVNYDEAASIEAFNFDPLAGIIFKEGVMKPRTGAPVNQELLTTAQAGLASKLDSYETILSHRAYLAGPNVTLPDLFHLPLGSKLVDNGLADGLLLDAKKRPNVARWWKSLYERPAWQAVLKDVKNWQEAEEKRKAEEQAAREKEAEKHHHSK